jgi:bifunctional UDP-N-acetylglucosamine pyrophosphorylase/glucosamine-1-phosphate N-acetyltransferase
MPLLDHDILKKIINSNANITLTSTMHPNPIGYGRLIRSADKYLEAIIEEKHLTSDQYFVREVNAGLYKFNVDFLKKIEISKNQNSQEWYLTSLWDKGSPYLAETQIIVEDDYRLLTGVNSWQDFEQAEAYYYQLQRESLVKQGVLLKNNQSIYIQGKVIGANHATIEGPCILKGPIKLAPGVSIQPFTTIADVALKDSTTVGSFSYLKNIF